MSKGLRRGVRAALALPLVTACAITYGGGSGWGLELGESDESDEFDESLATPDSIGFLVAVSDSVYRECDSDAPAVDSAYHFLNYAYLLLRYSDESAEIGVWFDDSNDASPLRRCGSTSTDSGGGTMRPGTFSGSDFTFTWSAVLVPDTTGLWITNEDLSLDSLTEDGSATLTWRGESMPARVLF